MDKKVFISYSTKDATYANLLAKSLKEKGVDVFSSREPLSAGMDMDTILRRELEESSAVVPLISENWAQSNWAATEYGAAYAMGKKIIPVVLDDFKEDNMYVDINKFSTVDAKNEDLESVASHVEEAL